MSVIDVLNTTLALLEDPTQGLAKTMQTLSGASTPPALNFVPWKLTGTLHPGRTANVTLRPVQWQPSVKRLPTQRDAVVQLELGYESFQSDAAKLEADIAVAATAFAQITDALRQYSDDHAGTVVDVIDPVTYLFGQFEGGTSSGFTATITIEERAAT